MATHDNNIVDAMRRRVIELEFGKVIRDQARGVYGVGAERPPRAASPRSTVGSHAANSSCPVRRRYPPQRHHDDRADPHHGDRAGIRRRCDPRQHRDHPLPAPQDLTTSRSPCTSPSTSRRARGDAGAQSALPRTAPPAQTDPVGAGRCWRERPGVTAFSYIEQKAKRQLVSQKSCRDSARTSSSGRSPRRSA